MDKVRLSIVKMIWKLVTHIPGKNNILIGKVSGMFHKKKIFSVDGDSLAKGEQLMAGQKSIGNKIFCKLVENSRTLICNLSEMKAHYEVYLNYMEQVYLLRR